LVTAIYNYHYYCWPQNSVQQYCFITWLPPSTRYQPWWIEGQAEVTQCWINSIKTDLELLFQ